MRIRRILRLAHLHALDARDAVLGRRTPMTPSRAQIEAVGGGDFAAIGDHLARLVIEDGGLQAHERILDVGCGIGRLAVPLTRHLTSGSYLGFDVSQAAIDWCVREISSRHPNFTFEVVDVFSRHYNPRGRVRAEEFRFPCVDGSVDVAFLGSILTHLTPPAAAQYVAETARVLRRGGRAVMTFFLLDEEVREKSRRGEILPQFASDPEPWWSVQKPEDPEAAVAFDLTVTKDALTARGLTTRSISRGMWTGNGSARTYQDLVVAVKE